MKFFGLGVAALVMTISASATQVTAVCGTFTTAGSYTFTCPSFSALDAGGTVLDAEIVYESDYSSGILTPVTEQTIFGFSGNTSAFAGDTVTTTGGSSSTSIVSSDGLPFNASNPPVLAGFYNTLTTFTGSEVVTAVNSITGGSALSTTGYVQLVFDYTPASVGSAPEPGSMMLLGSGLLVAGLVGRKKFGRK